MLAFDIANPIKDIDDNNEEGPDKGNEDDAGFIGRPEQDRHRHPGQWWNRPQQFKHWEEQVSEFLISPEQEP